MSAKTHAMRILESNGVPYRATTYDASGAFHAGAAAAALLGAPPEAVYKTLVVLREDGSPGKPLMVLVPSALQVDLKQLASEIGTKKLRMATLREAERLTGMQVGGISALGLRKPTFDVFIDEAARSRERLHVSAGVRGIDLELAVDDLARLTGARFVRATS